MTASEIKKFFLRRFNIPVCVRKVAVKHPFFQIWIHHRVGAPVYEFPAALGNQLLAIVYGDGKGGEGTNVSFPAGNMQKYSLSIYPHEWEKLMELYPTQGSENAADDQSNHGRNRPLPQLP